MSNLTRGLTLATRTQVARGLLARGRGLLGRCVPAPGAALVIAPCTGVHTFGMRFPIDVLFLRARSSPAICAGVANALSPGRIGPLIPGARAVIELPAGAAGPTRAGDIIAWEGGGPVQTV